MGLLSGGLSKVTDAIGLTDTGSGAAAAQRAGQVSAEQAALARGALGTGRTAALGNLAQGTGQAIGTLQPLAGLGLQGAQQFAQGGTTAGFTGNIMELLQGGGLDQLVSENRRNVLGELSSAGLTRSGEGIASLSRVPTETAFGIEQMLSGRQAQTAGLGLPALSNIASLQQGLGLNQANINTGFSQNLANIFTGQGQQQVGAILGGQQAEAAERGQLAQLLAAAAGAAGAASDIRLKENIVKHGEVGGLDLVSWDWKEGFSQPYNTGFIAQQVLEKYPEFVVDIGMGYLGIDYDGLNKRLEVH